MPEVARTRRAKRIRRVRGPRLHRLFLSRSLRRRARRIRNQRRRSLYPRRQPLAKKTRKTKRAKRTKPMSGTRKEVLEKIGATTLRMDMAMTMAKMLTTTDVVGLRATVMGRMSMAMGKLHLAMGKKALLAEARIGMDMAKTVLLDMVPTLMGTAKQQVLRRRSSLAAVVPDGIHLEVSGTPTPHRRPCSPTTNQAIQPTERPVIQLRGWATPWAPEMYKGLMCMRGAWHWAASRSSSPIPPCWASTRAHAWSSRLAWILTHRPLTVQH
mmetsp:Transcript_11047/g.25279  ORF Transcript_11047/g.25279 Transcript_11047/m.25279 type:complete len:269 (+) Transcript_11047:579-1385(+)